MITLTINGRHVEVDDGTSLLEAAKQAGIHVPTLCYYPGLPAHAVCRICLVEIEGTPNPQPACRTLAKDGDVVATDTEALAAFRKADAQWLLARHPNDCMRCEVNGACQLQRLVHENQWEERWPKMPAGAPAASEELASDHTSPSIWRDLSKCIECGLCAEVCGDAVQNQNVIGFANRGFDRRPVTVFDVPLSQTNCISCGQCTLVCPVGALIEAPHWHAVLQTLDAHRRVSVVQVAPATRIAISEEFGLEPGTVSTGRLINALRLFGFDYVFDTNFAADLTIMEEGTELLSRLKAGTELPLFTSCCPGWVNWVELNRPDLLPHLSTTKSPQQMHGAIAKRGRFARSLGPDFAEGKAEPYVVSVMPCTAKKDEAQRPGVSGDVDHVLTTRELARMIRSRGIPFGALSEDGQFDSPLGESTGAAQIFGASGGVMEAMVRTAAHFKGIEHDLPLEWEALRGVREGVKTATIPGVGTVAVCNGIASAQRMLEDEAWRDDYVAIEVMACVGGCLGGGGEPKSMDPHILQKRAKAIYSVDAKAPRRRSYENADVQALYDSELGAPNSPTAHRLLHTHYAARHSKRSLLMRFLDCVDRRDGAAAAKLFHPDGVWSTASPFGVLTGADEIAGLINAKLPPNLRGAKYARHQMESASDIDDLMVLAPDGSRSRFDLELSTVEADGYSQTVIQTLTRTVR
ncbi:[FeFe] hydrogenase, group A [Thioclava sp. JE_KL1]|uniref:[FeFe] hydrogenase, group A n=1 Tax=Thioclava sp. JE_KL1 TaxID=2651187 RepID=UPI00128D8D1F|nr:[FeFe] hydrogenase, group A [Thioclava sp. JE_KL1]MPQ93194.1 2Fe-2S iron-sulfur cluster binding domain-containing protein [Thioclava sp. JE_KL1]